VPQIFQIAESHAVHAIAFSQHKCHVSRLKPKSADFIPGIVKQKTVAVFSAIGIRLAPTVSMGKSNQPEISHSVSIDVEPPVAYLALTEPHHVHKWWSADSYMEPFVGGKLKLGALQHDCTLVVDRMESGRLVEWRCIEARSGAAKLDACVGTRVRFLLARNDRGGTEVSFSHRGWRSDCDCFKAWDSRWLRFAGKSLKSYLETGLGDPAC
jgi:uncharacterized protein YndB with AHSA1/START domain